ncbi:protein kinase [Nocardia sp. NPDC005998]|uniref:protein kinase domain-containing protein n=1 Tax=Nocardia sp. NPDC005998 TaxID=3156894 RepID=UPI0033B78F22
MVLRTGEMFAGFVIEGVLGAGGMGVVYTARHPRMDRRVALKVLNDAFATDPRARAAFDREAALAARLDHPNIVTVYDRSAADDPMLWLAMRHIPGGDASTLLTDAPGGVAPELAVELIADAAAALDYAHSHGVLHRDVKPANLLIEADSRRGQRALLADFGIARTLDGTVTLSAISASFAYAAPERFTRQAADHRGDIYSLGCTLHHLLTGHPPFPRDDQAAVIGAHLGEPPPAPSRLRPGLPAGLDLVIATALAKNPAERYPSCAALADATRHAITPARARTTGAPQPVPESEPTAWYGLAAGTGTGPTTGFDSDSGSPVSYIPPPEPTNPARHLGPVTPGPNARYPAPIAPPGPLSPNPPQQQQPRAHPSAAGWQHGRQPIDQRQGMGPAVAAVLLSILGCVVPLQPWIDLTGMRAFVGLPFGIAALVLGIVGCTGQRRGKVLAVAGMILSAIALAIEFIAIVIVA